MDNYQKTFLGEPARDYFINALQGWPALSQMVLSRVRKNQISVYAFLPPDTPLEDYYSFRTAASFDIKKHMELTLGMIKDFLRSSKTHSLIIGDIPGRKSDPFIQRNSTSKYLFYGEEVYGFILPNFEDESFNFDISHARDPFSKIFLVNTPEELRLHRKQEIDEAFIKMLAEHTVTVGTQAWDFDGFLFFDIVSEA
ncbi:MAG: hypothetical protein R3F48_05940 [Candidatus Zixiibacteriota bacterium]